MYTLIRLLFSVLAVALVAAAPNAQQFSWQKSHAKVTAEGDLEWAPLPFVFQPGSSLRYIDYENGNDDNPGNRTQPWKHHPWDAQATGKAAQCTGIQTYVFKRGVVYRGLLVAKESGQPGNPIRLTSDPSWGKGEASLYGSKRISGSWTRANAQSAPGIPSPESVWYKDIGTEFKPHSVWMAVGGAITRISLARDPNWKVSNPDDVKSEWYVWEKAELVKVMIDGGERARAWAVDPVHLTAKGKDAYAGGTVWTEFMGIPNGVMGTPYPTPIEQYDPERRAILVAPSYRTGQAYLPATQCRYFLENLPQFLDVPGEYYFVQKGPLAGRLYVRLPGEQDPSRVAIELAERPTIVDIREKSHIHISGLTFRFQNAVDMFDDSLSPAPEVNPACVKALGACQNIRVANCKFEHIVRAFVMVSGGQGIADEIAFNDNEIQYADYGPIIVSNRGGTPPAGNLYRFDFLRNRLYEVGVRTLARDHGHAVQVNNALIMEIAGNVLDRCWGAGLYIHGGKSGGAITRPLSRVLMHHNKVTSPLLNTNDWGGIEFWQNGPAYIYDNISGNPGGYWHWSDVAAGKSAKDRAYGSARFGFAYYLDGGFKSYVFNNVAWGQTSDLTSPLCAATAFHEVIGFMNAFFNNTAYRFGAPFRRQASMGGQSAYLGNLVMETSDAVFRHVDVISPRNVRHFPAETTAYANNVIVGRPRDFGYFDLDKPMGTSLNEPGISDLQHGRRAGPADRPFATLEEFRAALAKDGALASQTGWQVEGSPVLNAEKHDFRPRAGSSVIDRGVKYFVPWSLSAVVGEWQFYKLPADPTRILGENWYNTEEYTGRDAYYRVPRNDLKAHNVTAADYVKGTLEDWTEGALSLNGRDQFCSIADADLRTAGVRSHSRNLDMDTNDFLIEAVFRTTPGHTGGSLVSKLGSTGYAMDIDNAGRIRLRIDEYARASRVAVNDGKWHHVVVEVDRAAPESIRIYIDGKPSGGPSSGSRLAPNASLTNSADFLVGKSFAGTIDYLRVARGTLADARTSIEELYKWEFDGPFLTDFRGKAPTGARRDAGAYEYAH